MTTGQGKTFIFRWLTNIVALIPGLFTIKRQIPLPPGVSPALLGGFVEAIGAFIVLFSLVNKQWFYKRSARTLNRLSLFSLIFFLIGFLLYLGFMHNCVLYSNHWAKEVFTPLWISGEKTAAIIHEAGGPQNFLDDYGVDALNDLLREGSWFSLYVTEILFYLLFLLPFIGLTMAFTFLWIRYRQKERA